MKEAYKFQDQQSWDLFSDHEYLHQHVFLSNLYKSFLIASQHIFHHEDNILQNQVQQWKETQNPNRKIVLMYSYLISFSRQILIFLKNGIGQPLEFYEALLFFEFAINNYFFVSLDRFLSYGFVWCWEFDQIRSCYCTYLKMMRNTWRRKIFHVFYVLLHKGTFFSWIFEVSCWPLFHSSFCDWLLWIFVLPVRLIL